jgi:hypothetical protein
MTDVNPWLEIPLEDYEGHMSHHMVGQSRLLNSLTKKYLELIKPSTVVFLGIAGGNGLEHIDRQYTKSVIGIDINQEYLDVALKRYNDRIASLQLLNLDIVENPERICHADLIWAALVLEYTGTDKVLDFCENNIRRGGQLVISIQSNNDKTSVSSTGIESVKKVGTIFSAVDPDALMGKAAEAGYKLIEKEKNELPNGKSIITFQFVRL